MKKSEINFNDVKMGELVDIDAKVKELLDNKQYEEVIQLMDIALEKEQNSAYYFYRAYARNKISRNWDKNFKLILEDLNKAIAIDNDEDSLYLRFEVLHQYLQNQHSLLYSMEDGRHNIKSINNDGDLEYYSETENLKWTDKEAREIEKYDALMDESIDMLLELYPKASYYCMKSDWYTKDRLKNIEKACELDPQPWYFKRKADIEIEEGLYERALNSVVRAKERNQGKIDSDLTYKHARLLIILGENDTAASVIKELVPVKKEEFNQEKPILLTKGRTWSQGYYGIELFYLAGKIDEYANLLSEYYKENPDWVPLELIQRLFEDEHYNMIRRYFNNNDHKPQSVLFMNVCALLAVKEINSAKELIKDLNGEQLFQECVDINLTPISQEKDVRKSRVLRFEQPSYGAYDDIDVLFSFIRFDKLGVNIFINMVEALFFKKDHLDLYEVYQYTLNSFNKNNQSMDNDLRTDELYADLYKSIRRMKLMQAILHELPYLRSKDPAKMILLQNRFELALSKFIVMEIDKIESNAKETERREMMNRLAHNIKGIVSSISFPLERMKKEVPDKARKLDEAIRGSNLIREMVNTINYSYNTKIDHIKYDIKHAPSECGSIYDILVTSLRDSITNVLYDKHFSQYKDQYFISSEAHNRAIEEWENIFDDATLINIVDFSSQHLFSLDCDIDKAKLFRVGNDMGSYLKLSMMFLEIVLNAAKYSAYVPHNDRKISISFSQSDSHLIFNVSNKFNPEIKAISTGIGQFIIKNYSLVLDCIPDILIENGVYSLTMKFKNYWR